MISKLREKMGKSSVVMMLFFATFVTALILSFNAVADIDAFKIVGAEISARDTGVSGDVTDFDANTVESDTVFHRVGDTITYNLSVKNQHDKNYKIISITDDNTNENVSYNYDTHAGEKVAAGASFDLEVEVEYVSGVASLNDRDQHLVVNFEILYEEYTEPEPDPTPEPDDGEGAPVVPDTGADNLSDKGAKHSPILLIVLVTSAVLFIICVWRSNKRNQKRSRNGGKIIVCLLVTASLIPAVANALTEASGFEISTDYSLLDKLAITLNVDGSENVVPVTYGATVSSLPTPSKDNYDSVGWKDDGGNILPGNTELSEDTKLTAVFEEKKVTVTFNANGGVPATTEKRVQVNAALGDNIPADPNYDGHLFDGWFTAADGGDVISASTTVGETDITFFAHWTADISNATVSPDSMTLNWDVPAEATGTFTITGDNLESYTIASSDDTIATVDSSTNTITGLKNGEATITITGDRSGKTKTIAVNVQSVMRTASFHHNDDTGNKDEISVRINSALGSVPAGPSRNHYTFAGWFTAAEGGEEVTSETVIGAADVDYYAHWTIDQHAVTFKQNYTGAPADQTINVDWNTAIGSQAPNDPSRANYLFDGWYDAASGGNKADPIANEVITGDITFFAHWTADISNATVSPDSMTLNWDVPAEATGTFTITGDNLESYTIASSDDTIATVDSSTNTVTGLKNGEATITITGDRSGKTKTIAVTVNSAAIVCRPATTLHTAQCGSGGGCYTVDAIPVGGTITYGQLPGEDSPKLGDAYDCDVNNDGDFNSDNERFYYLNEDSGVSSLIFYSGFEGANGPQNSNIFLYEDITDELPSRSQWSHPAVGEIRIPSKAEIKDACGEDGEKVVGCRFIMEGTRYESNTTGRSAFWLQKVETDPKYDRVFTPDALFQQKAATENSKNAVRPIAEIPTSQIGKTYLIEYNVEGGAFITGEKYQQLTRGDAITNIPTVSKTSNIFDGWYTQQTGGTKLESGHIPAGDETYYARYKKTVAEMVIANPHITVDEGYTAQIVISNAAEIGEPYTFSVTSGSEYARVDNNGLIVGDRIGDATITILGTISGATKTVSVSVIEHRDYYIVSFDVDGGDPVSPIQVTKNHPISDAVSALPTTTKTNNKFTYWYKDTNHTTRLTLDTIIDSDVTYYAWWVPTDTVAVIEGSSYHSHLQDAFDAAPTDGSRTTVTLIEDITDTAAPTSTIKQYAITTAGQEIILDLNGHTLRYIGSANSYNVIKNAATLEICNGTITSNARSGAVDSEAGSKTILHDVVVSATGARQAVYNSGGEIYVGDGAVLSSTTNERGALDTNAGKTVVAGGTITSTGAYAMGVKAGTLIIGEQDGDVDPSKPIITGKTWGIVVNGSNSQKFELYDGIVRVDGGGNGRIGIAPGWDSYKPTGTISEDTTNASIRSIEMDSVIMEDVADGYMRLYLEQDPNKVHLFFDGNGGTVPEAEQLRSVDIGDPIGSPLPNAMRANYILDGWFTAPDDSGYEISGSMTAPSTNTTYYAHWTPERDPDEVVVHNLLSQATQNYFNNVSVWSASVPDYYIFLKSNFESGEGCSLTSKLDYSTDFGYRYASGGTIDCDRPVPYDTGASATLTVRLSDENTKIKNGAIADYVNTDNGVITNMIPGNTYYWEMTSDPGVYGYVKAVGERRLINLPSSRNVRDLGGLASDFGGTIKYGKIFRGEEIKTTNDKSRLVQLGVTKEYETRYDASGPVRFPDDQRADVGMIHYNIKNDGTKTGPEDKVGNKDNYTLAREAVASAMEDLANGESIYIHCSHGADRTGTLVYLLEGLLGVGTEDRYEDYELTTFAGQSDRTRYYEHKVSSSTEFVWNRKFEFMTTDPDGVGLVTSSDIYDWFMDGSTNTAADEALIQAFRAAMLE